MFICWILFYPLIRLSKKVAEIAIDLSTEISYARSSRILQETLGVKVKGFISSGLAM
jgi:hypothetical protein